MSLTLKVNIAIAILAEVYRLWKGRRAAAVARTSHRSV
jgi:hypothetical protein